jgi:ArsR family transcriptional regulator
MNVDEKSPATVSFAKALADTTRQKIMQACCCEWCSVGELVVRVGVGQPTVSHHLAILRDAGLVHMREAGRQTFYSLNQDAVVSCCGRLVAAFAPEREALIRPDDIV